MSWSGAEIDARKPADLADCVRALCDSHTRDQYPMVWPEDPAAWLTPGGLLCAWVGRMHKRLVGHVALVAGPDGWASISRLFVSPPAQGLGVAVALLDAALAYAVDRRLRVELDVVEESDAAIRLYERLGWTMLEREPAPFTWPDGSRPMQRRYVAPVRG